MRELKIEPQPHQLALLESEDRIVFFGGGVGAGKSWTILVDNLQGVHDPKYESAFFRTNIGDLEKTLWPEAKELYAPILFDEDDKPIGKSHIHEQKKIITFASGAKSYFSYLEYDGDVKSWYGAQLCKIYFDEFQFRSEFQFNILRTRNRSMAARDVLRGIRCTCNPDPEHFMLEWIKYYLDEDGFPISELSGVPRYYIYDRGDLYTDWSKEELDKKFPPDPDDPDDEGALSYTYIPAKLADNKILLERDKSYKKDLNNLPEAERKALLLGCWAKLSDSGMYFQRGWLGKVDFLPKGLVYARGWDTASTEPSKELKRDPDFTVGIKMGMDLDSRDLYICGMSRFQKRPGARDNEIVKVAHRDGAECKIVMAIDPAGAGKFQYGEFAKRCAQEQLICKEDPMANNKSKMLRFEPFSNACENGLVYICESSFEPEELKQFYKELENYTGADFKSTRTKKDDIVDACATVYNYLVSANHYKFIPFQSIDAPTILKSGLDTVNHNN